MPPPGHPLLQSPAYSPSFKLMAIALTTAIVLMLGWMMQTGQFGISGTTGHAWLLSAAAMLGWTLWHILRSTTTLTDVVLHQTWIWDKQIALPDMAYAKLIRVRGLAWLIAPRLYVRTLAGKFLVFYAARPEMVAAFERLEQETAALHGKGLG